MVSFELITEYSESSEAFVGSRSNTISDGAGLHESVEPLLVEVVNVKIGEAEEDFSS